MDIFIERIIVKVDERMAYQSEYALENELLRQLDGLGYERVNVHNVEQLHDNFRQIINERHMDKLEGRPLTDREFERLIQILTVSLSLIVQCNYVINMSFKEMMIRLFT